MALLERGTRVGRSQGASIFWGLISACFAAAACFYFWKNHENEASANQMRDTVLQLKEENESLNAQKEHLQASRTEAEASLKTREDLVQEKETELAAEEARLDSVGQQSQIQSQQNQAQVAVVKKFNDLIKKLGKDNPPDVVERGGRPVLRVPNGQLFMPSDSTLTAKGKALLSQVAQTVGADMDGFELRIVVYTDSGVEADAPGATTPQSGTVKGKPGDADGNPLTPWALTSSRAATIAQYFRDSTQLPFVSVLVMARGDSESISKENHARNRRVEITVTPQPVPFHAPELEKAKAAPDSSTPAADAGAKKDKAKTKKADGDSAPAKPQTRTH